MLFKLSDWCLHEMKHWTEMRWGNKVPDKVGRLLEKVISCQIFDNRVQAFLNCKSSFFKKKTPLLERRHKTNQLWYCYIKLVLKIFPWKLIEVCTSQDFQSMFGHFSSLWMKGMIVIISLGGGMWEYIRFRYFTYKKNGSWVNWIVGL